jgi:hypothetical protein
VWKRKKGFTVFFGPCALNRNNDVTNASRHIKNGRTFGIHLVSDALLVYTLLKN